MQGRRGVLDGGWRRGRFSMAGRGRGGFLGEREGGFDHRDHLDERTMISMQPRGKMRGMDLRTQGTKPYDPRRGVQRDFSHRPLRVRRNLPHLGSRHSCILRRGIHRVTERSLFGEWDVFAVVVATSVVATPSPSRGTLFLELRWRRFRAPCFADGTVCVHRTTWSNKEGGVCEDDEAKDVENVRQRPWTKPYDATNGMDGTCAKADGRACSHPEEARADVQRRGACRPASCVARASRPTQEKRPASAASKTKIGSSPTCMESTIRSCRCAHVQDGRRGRRRTRGTLS